MKRKILLCLLLCLLISTGIFFNLHNDKYNIDVQNNDDNCAHTLKNTQDFALNEDKNNHQITSFFESFNNNKTKDKKYVYLGGNPLGIDVKTNGLVITGKQEVITAKGVKVPCADINLKNGDMLISIDNKKVFNENDVKESIEHKDKVTIEIDSNGIISKYQINTAKDVMSGKERLGLWLKDGITGIGTLTYVDPKTRRYGALGHPIEENKTYKSGHIYNANIDGYIKGQRGKAGELDGSIRDNYSIGTIDKNTNFGIFGTYMGCINNFKTIEIASRNEVKPGKAYIYTTINGKEPKRYEIEIIKRNVQNKPQNKGMVIRIIDEELLSKTNGILQGMSGSPIIQDDKLIGAVTHVFINDPTKGFGMYLDFMLGN